MSREMEIKDGRGNWIRALGRTFDELRAQYEVRYVGGVLEYCAAPGDWRPCTPTSQELTVEEAEKALGHKGVYRLNPYKDTSERRWLFAAGQSHSAVLDDGKWRSLCGLWTTNDRGVFGDRPSGDVCSDCWEVLQILQKERDRAGDKLVVKASSSIQAEQQKQHAGRLQGSGTALDFFAGQRMIDAKLGDQPFTEREKLTSSVEYLHARIDELGKTNKKLTEDLAEARKLNDWRGKVADEMGQLKTDYNQILAANAKLRIKLDDAERKLKSKK